MYFSRFSGAGRRRGPMATDRVVASKAVVVAIVAVAASLVLVGVLSIIPSSGPGSVFQQPTGPITYSSETIQIPSSGPPWGPVMNTSFEGVQFLFCPVSLSTSWFYLQGTGTEVNGARFAFVVVENNSTFLGIGSPLNPSVEIGRAHV